MCNDDFAIIVLRLLPRRRLGGFVGGLSPHARRIGSKLRLLTNRYRSSDMRLMVGSNGLEPSTSRLSGVRSNHLSYEPM